MIIAEERMMKLHGKHLHYQFELLATESDYIIATEYEDHYIRKNVEYHLLDDNGKCEYIQYDNIDKNGDYFTRTKIINMSEIGLKRLGFKTRKI